MCVFTDILKIDHLWMMENLTVLSLAHNAIETIENLEELKNLVELNLSYNKIEKIEGLEVIITSQLSNFHPQNLEPLNTINENINSILCF